MFIALTGGIAAGKSTALSLFEKNGIRCYDTDLMVHEMYQNSEKLRKQLFERWGISEDLDPVAVRRKVADIVFADIEQLHWLESVIHPLIIEKLLIFRSDEKDIAVCAVPLLYETGMEKCFDFVVAVSCPEKVQHERLRKRGWSDAEIKARSGRQFTMAKKEKLADFVLENAGSLDFLESQCIKLIENWEKIPVQN